VLFTSGSTVRGLLEGVRMSGDEDLLHSTGERLRFACIGATTAAAAREAGLSPVIVSTEHTASGLVSAILKAETESNK
jgi:uroporphyrinogen-III synthase